MTKQQFAQELMLRQVAGIGLHHTHGDYASSIINMARKCLITVQMIDKEVPSFFDNVSDKVETVEVEPT